MRPVLITGASGMLGRAFVTACASRNLACHATSRAELDIADPDAMLRLLDRLEPWLVVNAAGYVRVDDAEDEAERCHRENTLGAGMLARSTAARAVPLVTFSTDLVFDGRKDTPYLETDAPAPLSVYGRSKHAAEEAVRDAHSDALMIRTSAFFGDDAGNFVTSTLRQLAAGEKVFAASDTVVSPTYVPDLVHACLDLAIDGERGLWHLANVGATSWAELALTTARCAGYPPTNVIAVPASELPWRARRPVYSALGSSRGALLGTLPEALERHLLSAAGALLS